MAHTCTRQRSLSLCICSRQVCSCGRVKMISSGSCSIINAHHTVQAFPIKIPFVCFFPLTFGAFGCLFRCIWSRMITPNDEANVSKALFSACCWKEAAVACFLWCAPLFVVCPSHMGWISGLWAAIEAVLGGNYDSLCDQICSSAHIRIWQIFNKIWL